MAYTFLFPDLGEGLTEGKLLQWYVSEGQSVNEGDPVAKVETDKVVADIPIPRSGRISRLHGKVDETLIVGNPLVELDEGDGAATAVPAAPAEKPAAAAEDSGPGVVGNIEVATGSDVMPASGEGMSQSAAIFNEDSVRVRATPVARKMARDLGVELTALKGTGPGGRIMKAASQAPSVPEAPRPVVVATGGTRVEELSQLRKAIARHMVESKFTAPHATTFEEVEVSRLVELRQSQKSRYADMGLRLSYMPFICKAVATALLRHPKLNCRLDMNAGQVVYHDYVNLGLAVDTPDGLIVPVIRDAHALSIRELALAIQDMAERARRREIRLDELKGGTFTLTNYGAIAGIFGAPIINAPESAILGIGRLLEQPVVKDHALAVGHVLPLSLAVDHRVVDGGDAARFLKELMNLLADPLAMLMD
jgi:pyruvate dehydrogenase E2 component (dihydrolipoamide acetyltransferase)